MAYLVWCFIEPGVPVVLGAAGGAARWPGTPRDEVRATELVDVVLPGGVGFQVGG
jgi:hypothetical protein